jgi:hypothetical protein
MTARLDGVGRYDGVLIALAVGVAVVTASVLNSLLWLGLL